MEVSLDIISSVILVFSDLHDKKTYIVIKQISEVIIEVPLLIDKQ